MAGNSDGVVAPGSTPQEECGYQDVECWVRQLRAAGWVPVSVRTWTEVSNSTTWRSPEGLLYRGPYKAWLVMKGRA